MKKRALIAAAAFSMLLLPGCVADTYDLTEDEQNIIAEYAAGVLLRNDEIYTEALVTPTPTPTPEVVLGPTTAPEPTTAARPNGGQGTGKGDTGEAVSNAGLSEVYGLAGLEVEYKGYSVLESFSEGNNYVVKPASGHRLVKVDLTLANTAGIAQEINFGSLGMGYQLDCGGKNLIQPEITAQDLAYLLAEIPAGGSMDTYLIFEIKEDLEPAGGKLIVKRGSNTSIITLD